MINFVSAESFLLFENCKENRNLGYETLEVEKRDARTINDLFFNIKIVFKSALCCVWVFF